MTGFTQLSSSSVMRATGAAFVIVGGMIAAATGPLKWPLGSWAAAFTVLVLGVAQVVTGSARAYWQGRDAQPGGWWEFLVWNLGGLTVIAGTLLGSVATVAIGSALLVAGLVLALLATLHPDKRSSRRLLVAYRILLALLAVSACIGIAISVVSNS